MARARVRLDRDFTAGAVPRRLFGSFVEHMGRSVYTGIYEPGHPLADGDGLRKDVLELVREVGPTLVRYPGGNFVSGYRWEDGVGPREQRPTRLDPAWRSLETNAFGLHEFMGWAWAADVEPMMAVNLGTRGLQEARELVEYANLDTPTAWADARRRNGAAAPFDIRLWCLGNEVDGTWQTGHKTAVEYGRLAAETGRAMRALDPEIELVACGSSMSAMPTFGQWEREVLELCYEEVDHISAHAYYEENDDVPLGDFLASAVDMDHVISAVTATADAVRAQGRHRKHLGVSFDEWNVWYVQRFREDERAHGRGTWDEAPRVIEDEYSVTDALVVGTLLNTLVRRSDRVSIGCQAQLVNVIGMLRSEPGGPAWKQTTALPFQEVRRRAVGATALRPVVSSDRYETSRYGDVDLVDVSAVWHEEDSRLSVFLVNRSPGEVVELDLALGAFGPLLVSGHQVLAAHLSGGRGATNTEDSPARVQLHTVDGAGRAELVPESSGTTTVRLPLPPLSWHVVDLVERPAR